MLKSYTTPEKYFPCRYSYCEEGNIVFSQLQKYRQDPKLGHVTKVFKITFCPDRVCQGHKILNYFTYSSKVFFFSENIQRIR